MHKTFSTMFDSFPANFCEFYWLYVLGFLTIKDLYQTFIYIQSSRTAAVQGHLTLLHHSVFALSSLEWWYVLKL